MKFRNVVILPLTLFVLAFGIAVAPKTMDIVLCVKSAAEANIGGIVQTSDDVYTATFLVDGNSFAAVPTEYGSSITLPQSPSKAGYSFAGWSPDIPETMPENDLTFTAIWNPKTYIAVFMIDGEFYDSVNADCGDPINLPDYPDAREGYAFSGWLNVPASMPPGGITINGSFSINSYTMIYKVDGVEFSRIQLEYNAPVTAIGEPTKTGYTFSGWQDVPAVMPAGDVIIQGSFSINSYYVTYKVDGFEYRRIQYEYGAPVTAIDEPAKTGYTFSGWSDVPSVMPAEDITIQGSFSINSYFVIYKVNGVVYSKVSYEYGAPITAIEEPVQAGYIFSGWSNIPATMPAGDIEVIGTFSVKPRELESIKITAPPYKDTQPIQGLFLDPKGMVITAFYDDGSTVKIDVTNALINSGTVIVTPSIFNNAGSQTVTAKYLGMSDSVTVTVAARSAVSISISKYPAKTEYVIGDALNLSGGEICINYNNDTRSFLDMKASSVAASGYDPAKTGTQTITITYTNSQGRKFTASLTIAVKALGIPSSAKAEPSSYNSNKISWSAVTGASGYVIYRSFSISGNYTKLAAVKSISFNDTALVTNKMYFYKIFAYRTINGNNTYGSSSVIVCAKPIPSVPASPKAVSVSYNSIKITWSAVSGATGYVIYSLDSSSGTYKKLIAVKLLSYTNTSLTTGKMYSYKIIAYRAVNGVNVYGNPSAVTSTKPVPSAPASFTADKIGKTSIKLSWGKSGGAQGYEIYRKDSGSGSFKLIKSTSALSFSDAGLKSNNTYYYKIRAYSTISGVKVYGPFTGVKTAKPY